MEWALDFHREGLFFEDNRRPISFPSGKTTDKLSRLAFLNGDVAAWARAVMSISKRIRQFRYRSFRG